MTDKPQKISVVQLLRDDYGENNFHHEMYFTTGAKAVKYARDWEKENNYHPYWRYVDKILEIR